MKTTPTDLDREASALFVCADGMRAAWSYGSVTAVPPRERWAWERVTSDGKEPGALDVDDMPTVGEMLAQVEVACPGAAVSIVDRLRALPGETDSRFMVLVEHDGTQTATTGPTRGAALVAARRAMKGKA